MRYKLLFADDIDRKKLERLVSVRSIQSDAKKEVEETEEDEDLPEFSFMNIMRWNKPEIGYILSERLLLVWFVDDLYLLVV